MTPQASGPRLTVDVVAVHNDTLLLVRRGSPPFQGVWALPGGFVEAGETVERAAVREAHEETGLAVVLARLVGVYSDPARDPRGHSVSVVFLAAPADPENAAPTGGSDAAEARWHRLDDLPALAFDHARIVDDARRLR